MKFEIKNWQTQEVLFSAEVEDLRSAIEEAVKTNADLRHADLRHADLSDETLIETGETWSEYKTQVVPALLAAGGKELRQVIEASWNCHLWKNCPIAVAFNIHQIIDAPILFKPRIEQFIRYFDAHLLATKEEILEEVKR